MSDARHQMETLVVHGGEASGRYAGAATLPIFQSTVFETSTEPGAPPIVYPRLSNTPNHLALHEKIALLEGTEAGLVSASGMAAISMALIEMLGKGGHLIAQDTLYGGTHAFLTRDFADLGLSVDFVDATRPESWESVLKPETRAIYTEAMTNPLLQVADHGAVVAFAQDRGLVSMIDATFATPINFRPASLGYDLVLHSGTKYLNGHSDLVCGVVAGSKDLVSRVARRQTHLGSNLDMHACFLLQRGLKTLALRVRQQNTTALALARFLEKHPRVKAVNYAGLESSPGHLRAREWFSGFGGLLSFEVADAATAIKVVDALQIPAKGPSLGGVDSLVTRPVTTSHLIVPPAERARMGVRDSLIRYSVGIEALVDLQNDLASALET